MNTSFNVRGEPIVCTPADAFRCFMGTCLDRLTIGDCFLRKEDRDPSLGIEGHEASFEPDRRAADMKTERSYPVFPLERRILARMSSEEHFSDEQDT